MYATEIPFNFAAFWEVWFAIPVTVEFTDGGTAGLNVAARVVMGFEATACTWACWKIRAIAVFNREYSAEVVPRNVAACGVE